MRRIDKDVEPQVLVRWRRSSGELRYPDLSPEERRAIRSACLAEQYGLCAYCCQSITLDDSHNEHVEAQDRARIVRWTSPTLLPVASSLINAAVVEAHVPWR